MDATDATGNGYTLTENKTSQGLGVDPVTGILNQGRHFGRSVTTSPYLQNNTNFFGNVSWSVSFWFYLTSAELTLHPTFLVGGAFPNSSFFCESNVSVGNYYISLTVSTSDGGFGSSDFGQHIVADAWNLGVIGIDTSTLHYNNSLNGASYLSFGYTGTPNNASFFRVGDSNTNPLSMDEIGIWHKALSSTDVTNLYNSGAGLAYENFTVSLQTNLIAYWKFDESIVRPATPQRAVRRIGSQIARVYV